MADWEFVWLDAMGVIFQSADDLRELPSVELWRRLGVPGDACALDDAHLAAHRLTPGIVDFARAAGRAGVGVGCLANDVSEWAASHRTRHGLDALVTPWITSGDIKVRKPDPRAYEHVRRLGPPTPDRSLVVDDREVNLDPAKEPGFATVRFGGPPPAHMSVSDTRALTALIVGCLP